MVLSTRFVRKGGIDMVYEGMDAVRIGNKLKTLREEKSETMEQLSNAINVSSSAVAMYETGKRIPRDEIKIRIAEHFSVPVESIFFPK
jgi:DNA-binding XRE family transcriptional regulator